MRNLKKFLALVLAFMMAMSLMVTVNASSFKDDDEITTAYSEAVDVLTELGVINGYDTDGVKTFDPKANITRAEVAAIIYRIYTGDTGDKNIHLYNGFSEFTDVAADKWYTPYVNFCANNGLVNGVGGNRFAPSDNVTGYEALVMILRAIGYNNPSEFSSSDWRFKASGYGSRLGLTANVPAGSLGAAATREMVAEIMFKGLLAPMVNYSPLTQYTTDLLVKASEVNGDTKIYSSDVPNTLMYQTFGIVGKRTVLDADDFGRPLVEWMTDNSADTVQNGGKYIVNAEDPANLGTVDPDRFDASLDGANYPAADDVKLTLTMTPVKVYDNAIDECHLTKDINNDTSIAWGAISEVLNGKAVTEAATGTAAAAARTGYLDATHTTTKYIGATGRTTEIYKLDEKIWVVPSTGAASADQGNPANTDVSVNKWIFVYVDTLLGEVTATTSAIKDTAGHVIREATATVSLGNDTGAATLTLTNADEQYKRGDLVLIQTPKGADASLDGVEAPELAPLTPIDVPITTVEFTSDCVMLSTPAQVVENVTVNATVGARNAKMGIIGTDGTTYYASNSFLAARVDDKHATVLTKWYDGPDTSAANHLGINNSMIGRTFNLVLDHHGYIIGIDEVVASSSDVGVITGIDSKRVGSGKYVATIEAFMADGTTKSFDVVGLANDKGMDDIATLTNADHRYWDTASDAEAAWIPGDSATGDGASGGYGKFIGVGSLVKFASITMSDGGQYWKIDDWASDAAFDTEMADGTAPDNNSVVKGDVVETNNLLTGVTATLTNDGNATDGLRKLDNNSVVFVAEYEYRYNTKPGENEGSNTNKTYKVYEGFKNVPTVVTEDDGNILYQQLQKPGNTKYVLVYAKDTEDNYIIKDQAKITVDDSYLILSRGATYADHSVYNVLKNGVETTIEVSNNNSKLNEDIEATMDNNQLLLVTGRNSKGYVTSVTTVTTAAAVAGSVAAANVNNFTTGFELIAKDGSELAESAAVKAYSAGVLRISGTDASGAFLTVADDVIVKIVNRDLKTCYDSTMAEAMQYANGVDGTDAAGAVVADGRLASHDLVYELNEYGYVCALYVID